MRPALAGGAAVVVAGVTEDVGLEDCTVVLDAVVDGIWDVVSAVAGDEDAEVDGDVDEMRVVRVVDVVIVVDADAVSEAEINPAVEVKDTTVCVTILVLCTPVPEETVMVAETEVEDVDNPPPLDTITVLCTELADVELLTNTTPVVPTSKLQLTVGLKLDGKAANAEESTESAFVVAGFSTQPEGPAVQEVRVVKVEVSVVRMGIMVAVVWLDV